MQWMRRLMHAESRAFESLESLESLLRERCASRSSRVVILGARLFFPVLDCAASRQNPGSMSIMAMRASTPGRPGVKSTLGDFVSMHSNNRLERA
jgi:hypothetical protein